MPLQAIRASVVLLLLVFIGAPIALAHPMGNFSVNHYAKISLSGDGIDLRYFIDLAEIPTYQEIQQYSLTPVDPASVSSFLARRGPELQSGLSLRLDGTTLPLQLISKAVIFPPGAGGLPTLKMGYVFHAAYPAGHAPGTGELAYSDANYPGHAGWKEVVVAGPAALLVTSSAPATDRSDELSNYPTDMLNSPPQELSATARIQLPVVSAASVVNPKPAKEPASTPARAPGLAGPFPASGEGKTRAEASAQAAAVEHSTQPRVAAKIAAPASRAPAPTAAATRQPTSESPSVSTIHLAANRQGTARSAFTELVTTQHLSLWFLFTAAFISMGLGALHALEPGHGKTIVAAYLVGSRGTARHALLLGVIVTVAHTASVFALGAITLYASRYILPEQLYPWLSLLSGLTIAALGGYMLLRRWTGETLDHAHSAGEPHSHWLLNRKPAGVPSASTETALEAATAETLAPAVREANSKPPISLTQLFTLGITGGIIPCPAALVVLLSAFGLHRVGFGFFLISMFSIGLAAVLIGFGLLMVYARRFMGSLMVDGPLTRRWLPVASAAFMSILGAVLAWRGFAATGVSLHSFTGLTRERLGPGLFVAGLGLVLGMRHSTDADHVVAISTIVTRQRSIRGAAVIGSLWGLGHTLTIFAVGCLIILGGVVIPPRIGLSMEFSVGLMLILLGLLNLTGVMQKIVARFTPGAAQQTSQPLPQALPKRAGRIDQALNRYGAYQLLRPLAIGLVHGLAGSAAVALLVLSTIHNPLYAVGYLVIFGGGTMLGMMCMTAAMAMPLVYAGGRLPQLSRYLGVASGLVSVCFGTFLVYQLGYLNGLFTSHPHWTPQ